MSIAQVRAAVAVNTELIRLYWSIGHDILKASFPTMQGFLPRNLKYMRAFAAAWPDEAIVQRSVAQLSWRQNIALLDKLKDPELRLWYAQKVVPFPDEEN